MSANSFSVKGMGLPAQLTLTTKDHEHHLTASGQIAKGFCWGPYQVTKCVAGEGNLIMKTSRVQERHYRTVEVQSKWLENLKEASNEKEANVKVEFNDKNETVSVIATHNLTAGTELRSFMANNSQNSSQQNGKVCPYCGIRFTCGSTLKAHISSYCSKRPVEVQKVVGWPTRKRVAPMPPLPTETKADSPEGQNPFGTAIPITMISSATESPVQSPTSLGYCVPCGLFFASRELYDIHMRLDQAQLTPDNTEYANSIVLAVPVVTPSGIHYVPIHPRSRQDFPTSPRETLAKRSPRLEMAQSGLSFPEPGAEIEDNKPLDLTLPQIVSGGVLKEVLSSKEKGRVPAGSTAECPECKVHMPTDELVKHSHQNCANNVDAQVAQMSQLMRRPFLCTYCNTRFQSMSTFQAHQQFYCQGMRRSIALSPTRTQDTVKRRRMTIETTPPPVPAWSEVREGYRCRKCGYLGQTVRGMKMHNRIHESHNSPEMRSHPLISNPVTLKFETNGVRHKSGSEFVPQNHNDNSERRPKSADVVSELAVSAVNPRNNRTCRTCGTHYEHLEELLHHLKFGCPPGQVKQEMVSSA